MLSLPAARTVAVLMPAASSPERNAPEESCPDVLEPEPDAVPEEKPPAGL